MYFTVQYPKVPEGGPISVVHPKLFFPDPDPTLTLILDPDPDSNPDPAFL
jgi:hypothetical protein